MSHCSTHRSSSSAYSATSLLKAVYTEPFAPSIVEYEPENFICYYCGKQCKNLSGRILHEKKHKREAAKQKRRRKFAQKKKIVQTYECEECGKKYTNKSSLTKHRKKEHVETIECLECHKKFVNKMDFEWHGIYYHQEIDESKSIAGRTRSKSRLGNPTPVTPLRPESCVTFAAYPNGFNRVSSVMHMSFKSAPNRSINTHETSTFDVNSQDDILDWTSESSEDSSKTISSKNSKKQTEEEFEEAELCTEHNCNRVFKSLDLLTFHEIVDHKKLALFRCIECRNRYTSK